MEELSDKDFDQIFKNRIKEGYLEYEEESWLKMEKKLDKRNRIVFYRNASIILIFLSIGIGLYLMGDKKLPVVDIKSVKKTESGINNSADLPKKEEVLAKIEQKNTTSVIDPKERNELHPRNPPLEPTKEHPSAPEAPIINEKITVVPTKELPQNQVAQQNELIQDVKNAEGFIDVSVGKLIARRGITFSFNVGPDFNSTKNAIGGKSGVVVGVGINIPLSRKLSVQTGLNYGSKNYEAQGYDYTFNNPNTVNTIAGIDASCKVLEIPLRTSYTIRDNHKNSINLNVGLSSYIMLKENYRFMYTIASARNDRFLEKRNANQHYLSVIDLSATYNIKLKNKKFALGLEPYVKIPLVGIGEGNVPLKSSGVSLKLNYELNKKR